MSRNQGDGSKLTLIKQVQIIDKVPEPLLSRMLVFHIEMHCIWNYC